VNVAERTCFFYLTGNTSTACNKPFHQITIGGLDVGLYKLNFLATQFISTIEELTPASKIERRHGLLAETLQPGWRSPPVAIPCQRIADLGLLCCRVEANRFLPFQANSQWTII
jgi:hypothetical protein